MTTEQIIYIIIFYCMTGVLTSKIIIKYYFQVSCYYELTKYSHERDHTIICSMLWPLLIVAIMFKYTLFPVCILLIKLGNVIFNKSLIIYTLIYLCLSIFIAFQVFDFSQIQLPSIEITF